MNRETSPPDPAERWSARRSVGVTLRRGMLLGCACGVSACGALHSSASATATPAVATASPSSVPTPTPTPAPAAPPLPTFAPGKADLFFGNDLATVVPRGWMPNDDPSFAASNGIPSSDVVELMLEAPYSGRGTVPVLFILQLPPDEYTDPSDFGADLRAAVPQAKITSVGPLIPWTIDGEPALSAVIAGSVGVRAFKEWDVLVDHTTNGATSTYVMDLITSPQQFPSLYPIAERTLGGVTWGP